MLGEPIPKAMRLEMSNDPTYQSCLRARVLSDHVCLPDPMTGRLIEWEHALFHAGRKINEKWAIIPSCWWAHRGPGLDKAINQWLALNRATIGDFEKYPRQNFIGRRDILNRRYGVPDLSTSIAPF